jgi:hypothetical protein
MFKENTGLVLNCGYARTAICQLYGKPPSEKGKKRLQIRAKYKVRQIVQIPIQGKWYAKAVRK